MEVSDPALLDYPSETLDVMVTRKEIVGNTLGEFAEMGRDQRSRGVFVRALIRGGHELPFNAGTKIAKGDVLRDQWFAARCGAGCQDLLVTRSARAT